MIPKLSYIALAVSTVCVAAPGANDPYGPSQSDFGGAGLLQMPSARMAAEGEFSFNYMDNEEYRRWSISMQPFDWFEALLIPSFFETQIIPNVRVYNRCCFR